MPDPVSRFADNLHAVMDSWMDLLQHIHTKAAGDDEKAEAMAQAAMISGLKSVMDTEDYAIEELAGFCSDFEAAITEIDPDVWSSEDSDDSEDFDDFDDEDDEDDSVDV